jgi:hypothetical protein
MQAVQAQPVGVIANEDGQGYLFNDHGICYLLTAAHVTSGSVRAQIRTEDGREGVATMMKPFWPGFDLDVGQVRRLSQSDCTANFDILASGVDVPLAGARIVLPLVGPGGVDNPELSVTSTEFLEFLGAFGASDGAGKKGMSGSFALLDGVPVGMARATTEDGSIRFIQMAEIVMNLRRWLDRSAALPTLVEDLPPETQNRSGLPYEVISSSPAAIDSEHVIEAMAEGSAPFIYPAGQDAVIILRNLSEGQKVISRLRIESRPDEEHSQPRQIRIDLIAQEASGKAQFWKTDTFPPDGLYDTGVVARRFAAQVKITLIGARGDEPVRIDRIVLD